DRRFLRQVDLDCNVRLRRVERPDTLVHGLVHARLVYDRAMELARLFAYDDWANREEVARLGAIDAPPRAVRLLAHIVGTEWLWISRLRGTKPRFAVWPELTIEQCANELDALRDAWNGYLHEASFDTVIAYTNSLGESWTNRAGDVLAHVILHGAY